MSFNMRPPFVAGADRRVPVLAASQAPLLEAGILRIGCERTARAHRRCDGRPGLKNQQPVPRYFFLRAPERFAALKEMPARMAFC